MPMSLMDFSKFEDSNGVQVNFFRLNVQYTPLFQSPINFLKKNKKQLIKLTTAKNKCRIVCLLIWKQLYKTWFFRYKQNHLIPLRVSSGKTYPFILDLQLLSNGETYQYFLIIDVRKLVSKITGKEYRERSPLFRNCLHICSSIEHLNTHQQYCLDKDSLQITMPDTTKNNRKLFGKAVFSLCYLLGPRVPHYPSTNCEKQSKYPRSVRFRATFAEQLLPTCYRTRKSWTHITWHIYRSWLYGEILCQKLRSWRIIFFIRRESFPTSSELDLQKQFILTFEIALLAFKTKIRGFLIIATSPENFWGMHTTSVIWNVEPSIIHQSLHTW